MLNIRQLFTGSTNTKTTLVDADGIICFDSENSNKCKKITWANIKAALNSLYRLLGNITLAANDQIIFTLPTTLCTGNVISLTAGYSSAVGDVGYLASTGKILAADADLSVASYSGMLVMVLEAKTDTQAMKVTLPGALVYKATWNWTKGAKLYLSTTAGSLTETAPSATDSATRIVAYAISATQILFLPSNDYVVHV